MHTHEPPTPYGSYGAYSCGRRKRNLTPQPNLSSAAEPHSRAQALGALGVQNAASCTRVASVKT